jgi:hypothetical protein
MTRYLLDSNFFIQSKNFSYRFEFCQAFWDLIITLHNQGLVYSIQKVKQELIKGNDNLSSWVRQLPESFWLDEFDYVNEYNSVINWANNKLVDPAKSQGFTSAAKAIFADEGRADAWLIACASGLPNTVIVTQETKIDPKAYKTIKIPNAAQDFQVSCSTIYDFLSNTCENNFTPK